MTTKHTQPSASLCADGNNRGYEAICREAQRLGWPRLWAEDLTVHDRKRLLAENAPLEFAWAVRDTGTFLMAPDNPDDLEIAKALLFCREKHGCWPDQRYYWFNGTVLKALALETIIRQLDRSTA